MPNGDNVALYCLLQKICCDVVRYDAVLVYEQTNAKMKLFEEEAQLKLIVLR